MCASNGFSDFQASTLDNAIGFSAFKNISLKVNVYYQGTNMSNSPKSEKMPLHTVPLTFPISYCPPLTILLINLSRETVSRRLNNIYQNRRHLTQAMAWRHELDWQTLTKWIRTWNLFHTQTAGDCFRMHFLNQRKEWYVNPFLSWKMFKLQQPHSGWKG